MTLLRASMASSGTWHHVFVYDPHSLWVYAYVRDGQIAAEAK